MNFGIFFLILTLCLTSGVALFVAFRKHRAEAQTSYLVLISFFALWALFTLLVEITTLANHALLFERITYVLGLGIAWSFMGFALIFPHRVYRVNSFLIGGGLFVTATFLILIILVPDTLNLRVIFNEQFGEKIFFLDNRWLTAYILLFVSISYSAFYILFNKFFNAVGESRFQLKLVLTSTIIAFLGGLLFNLLTLYIKDHHYQIYGPSFTLFFTLVVAYLIFFRGRK